MENNKEHVVSRAMLFPFILITTLFALWGFANDITNPMVAAFKDVMEISNAKASLVQFAFYGGYALMAIPASIFIQKKSYKSGIMMGLGLYAIGAFLFYPAAKYQRFEFFLISYCILTFGLAFLETTSNPYILSMGSKKTATRRLNFAQAFNPVGSLMGMAVASNVVLANLRCDKALDAAGNVIRDTAGKVLLRGTPGTLSFSDLNPSVKEAVRLSDLDIIRNPYIVIGLVVLLVFVIIGVAKMPKTIQNREISFKESFSHLIKNANYREGVLAQVFYVGAQIMCWTFIIQYAGRLGISKADAQNMNIIAMCMFLGGRFISTYLMKFVNSHKLLFIFAICAMLTIAGTILIDGKMGLYCLMATSLFMSLMFPTIYGIALEDVGEYSTLGAAGLVMAIVGGSVLTPIQGSIIDLEHVGPFAAENFSFILPFICFIMISIYAYRCLNRSKVD